MKPLIITELAITMPAYESGLGLFSTGGGQRGSGRVQQCKERCLYPHQQGDDYMKFGEYLDMVKQGPVALRIFLFNIFQHAPEIVSDFNWPEELLKGFVKRFPMLFVGGAGSITHMHFDIDLSHILHTQFAGRKRVLLFPHEEQYHLYRKPYEVLSFANFENYATRQQQARHPPVFPPSKKHGVTRSSSNMRYFVYAGRLLAPYGVPRQWFSMSLRALQNSMGGKLKGAWNLFGMRHIDTLMKKTFPEWWYNSKKEKAFTAALRESQDN